MKTHIALVGGQPIPVYLGIQATDNLGRIILICSEQTKGEASRIASFFPDISTDIIACNPIQLQEIENCARSVFELVGDSEIVLNLTSGTKPWTLVFHRIFMSRERCQFILVDQNNNIQDLRTYAVEHVDISKEMRFKLNGSELTRFTRFVDYDEDDIDVMKQVEYARSCNFQDFKDLTVTKCSLPRIGKSDVTRHGSYVEWNKDEEWVKLHLYIRINHRFKEFYLNSKHAVDIVFNSGWFELKTAYEFSKNENVKDILLNCEFVAEDKLPKNEIDIILDMGNKLVFVECKIQVFDITAIDKFHSVIKNFSGTSSKGIFVVNDIPSEKNTKYQRAMEKCKDNNILTFNFELQAANPVLPGLNEIINRDLFKTNKR